MCGDMLWGLVTTEQITLVPKNKVKQNLLAVPPWTNYFASTVELFCLNIAMHCTKLERKLLLKSSGSRDWQFKGKQGGDWLDFVVLNSLSVFHLFIDMHLLTKTESIHCTLLFYNAGTINTLLLLQQVSQRALWCDDRKAEWLCEMLPSIRTFCFDPQNKTKLE